jgi:hypothetical protein
MSRPNFEQLRFVVAVLDPLLGTIPGHSNSTNVIIT